MAHKQIQAVLFDLDGTLLDTAADLGAALNYVLAQHDLPLCAYEDFQPIASHGAKGLLELGFGEQLAKMDMNTLRRQFLDYYAANLCVETQFFHGVEQTLATLDDHGRPWGIVTNKPGFLTDPLLEHFSAFANCQVVISGDTLPTRKPDPQPLLHAAKTINHFAETICYVGDAERDMQAANSAGMYSVLALFGYIHADDQPQHWGAAAQITQMPELCDLLELTR